MEWYPDVLYILLAYIVSGIIYTIKLPPEPRKFRLYLLNTLFWLYLYWLGNRIAEDHQKFDWNREEHSTSCDLPPPEA